MEVCLSFMWSCNIVNAIIYLIFFLVLFGYYFGDFAFILFFFFCFIHSCNKGQKKRKESKTDFFLIRLKEKCGEKKKKKNRKD